MIRLTRFAILSLVAFALSLTAASAGCLKPENFQQLQADFLKTLNAQRKANGQSPLVENGTLEKAAQGMVCDNARRHSVSHTGSDGSQLQNRLNRVGYNYRTAAENTGRNFPDARFAFDWWMHSPKHRGNMLNPALREIGIGLAISAAPESQLHWVLDFGAQK